MKVQRGGRSVTVDITADGEGWCRMPAARCWPGEANLAELLEGLRPRAEQAVASVIARAEELGRALDEWSYAAAEVDRLGGKVQWFRQGPRRTPSADVLNKLRSALGGLSVPLPLPVGPIESPAEEQERLEREHQAEVERRRAMREGRPSGVRWDPDHPLFEDAA